MTTSVSSINEYFYCPLKVYLKEYTKPQENITPQQEIQKLHGKIRKQVLKEYQNSVKKNFRIIQDNMNASEINQKLFKDIPKILRKVMKEHHINPNDEAEFLEDLKEDLKIQTAILALKTNQIINKGYNDPNYLSELLFPPIIENYLIKNFDLGLSGLIDKIEVVDGTYFPIKQKTGRGPLRGVWDSDALELAAYSILLEYEFNTEILVGFINYGNINDKRPVVINTKLREKLQEVLQSIYSIKKGILPEINLNLKKCEKCDYNKACKENIDFT